MIKICKICARQLETGKSQCSYCGKLNFPSSSNSVTDKYSTSVRLSDIKAEQTERIPFGFADHVFGETLNDDGDVVSSGIAIGSVNLLGGEAGVGKSTFCLIIADIIAGNCSGDEYVLIVLTEEKPATTKARAVRIGCENFDRIRVEDFSTGEKSLYDYIVALKIKPKVLFVDSTDGLSNDLLSELKVLTPYLHEHNISTILIHHLNKGMMFAGRYDVQHLVDSTIAFISLDDKEDTREMAAIKNRNGKARAKAKFYMNEDGLEEILDKSDFIHLKIGELPEQEIYLSRINSTELVIEVNDEEYVIESKEKAWENMNVTFNNWVKEKTDEALDLIEQFLNFAGCTWEEENEK